MGLCKLHRLALDKASSAPWWQQDAKASSHCFPNLADCSFFWLDGGVAFALLKTQQVEVDIMAEHHQVY